MQKADFMEPMKLIKIHGSAAEKWWPTSWSTLGARIAEWLALRLLPGHTQQEITSTSQNGALKIDEPKKLD
jgi:hypothetical protein